MQIEVTNALQETMIFGGLLALALIVFIRRKSDQAIFSKGLTNELKGVAVIAIILAHVGYFLSKNTQFLFPLSVYAGAGVDLFLFLSGFGLAASMLKNRLNPVQFYWRRLVKIMLPLWVILTILILADYFILNKSYPIQTVVEAFFGIVRRADLFLDINSPLWYITFIAFLYILFPLVFIKKSPTISAIIIFVTTNILIGQQLPVSEGVLGLYTLHTAAFPLGIIMADILFNLKLHEQISNSQISRWLQNKKMVVQIIRWVLMIGLMVVVIYFGQHSGWDKSKNIQQFYSILVMATFVFTMMLKKIEFKSLALVGMYSYEIYLIHWPLMYRYDWLYKNLPAGAATFLYLIVLIILGLGLSKLLNITAKKVCNP